LQDGTRRTPTDLPNPGKEESMTTDIPSDPTQERRRRGNPRPRKLEQQIALRMEDFTPVAEAARARGLSLREFIREVTLRAARRTLRDLKKTA
jgi:hypothetical protein